MLFGNGNAAIVELNEDMISYKPGTMKNISGASGIREAITVTKRDGIYHFTWSVDDTGSENYHVRYGTSNNIYGPINYRGIILQKDPSKDILGTGHHSILQIPGKDEYYIAYHRFGTPLSKYPSGKGFNRETCLDKVEFDENGYMKVITPTHEGITTPVTLDPVPVDEELTIVTSFNMSNLEPNQLLQANVDVTNHNREKGSVLVIVGLYDAQNRMVNVSYISKEIKIGESEHLRSGFRLPEDVTNHKVRVFVWDGNTLEDTSMEPLSNVVELR